MTEEPRKKIQTSEEKEAAVADLRGLLSTRGWEVLKLKLEDAVTVLQSQLEAGEFQTLEEVQRVQDKLRIARNLLYLPEDLIKQLQGGEQVPPILDVYE